VIIEVGPGSGGYKFNPYIKPSLGVVYVDINPPNSDIGDALWIVADAHHLPFRDGVADRVYAIHVIEHLEEPMLFLRECYRVLKKGGMVMIVTPNFMSVNALADPDHKHVFNFFKLRKMMREAGFVTRHRLGWNIGSLTPKPLRLFIKLLLILFSNDLIFVGVKS